MWPFSLFGARTPKHARMQPLNGAMGVTGSGTVGNALRLARAGQVRADVLFLGDSNAGKLSRTIFKALSDADINIWATPICSFAQHTASHPNEGELVGFETYPSRTNARNSLGTTMAAEAQSGSPTLDTSAPFTVGQGILARGSSIRTNTQPEIGIIHGILDTGRGALPITGAASENGATAYMRPTGVGSDWAYVAGGGDMQLGFYIKVKSDSPADMNKAWTARVGVVKFNVAAGPQFYHLWHDNGGFTYEIDGPVAAHNAATGIYIEEASIAAGVRSGDDLAYSPLGNAGTGGTNAVLGPLGFAWVSLYKDGEMGVSLTRLQYFGGASTKMIADSLVAAGSWVERYVQEVYERQVEAGSMSPRAVVITYTGINGDTAAASGDASWTAQTTRVNAEIRQAWLACGGDPTGLHIVNIATHPQTAEDGGAVDLKGIRAAAKAWIGTQPDAVFVDMQEIMPGALFAANNWWGQISAPNDDPNHLSDDGALEGGRRIVAALMAA